MANSFMGLSQDFGDQLSVIRETNCVCLRSVLCPNDPVANGEELGMMIGVLKDTSAIPDFGP